MESWLARMKIGLRWRRAQFSLGLHRFVIRMLPYSAAFVLAGFLTYGIAINRRGCCGPLIVGLRLPSEKAIVADAPVADASRPPVIHMFRYQPTGTEGAAGVPYWIFRALPRMFPEVFVDYPEGRKWEAFGLFGDADPTMLRGSGVPRGMVVADTTYSLPGARVGFGLKRVALNCAACHQGEYFDAAGQRVVVDGMPNHSADPQAYKRFIKRAISDPRFTLANVLAAVNAELTEAGHPVLTEWEEGVYAQVVRLVQRPTDKSWMDTRPDNGPGRIDAFSAVKYETLDAPDDGHNATVDLPSLWNQNDLVRPWHHWDGNTQDKRARNYGSIIGVGGSPLSVRGATVDAVGDWLDNELPVPEFPFQRPAPSGSGAAASREVRVARGKDVYLDRCAGCHGVYDPASRRVDASMARGKYMTPFDSGTDPLRRQAFDPATATALNTWGAQRGAWQLDSFHPAGDGYVVPPLDGIWARAPYLHNGSVPSLRALVTEGARPRQFWRGSRHYDPAAMGWVSDRGHEVPAGAADDARARRLFRYDTALGGNSNAGHAYYVAPDQVDVLLDYLATL